MLLQVVAVVVEVIEVVEVVAAAVQLFLFLEVVLALSLTHTVTH